MSLFPFNRNSVMKSCGCVSVNGFDVDSLLMGAYSWDKERHSPKERWRMNFSNPDCPHNNSPKRSNREVFDALLDYDIDKAFKLREIITEHFIPEFWDAKMCQVCFDKLMDDESRARIFEAAERFLESMNAR